MSFWNSPDISPTRKNQFRIQVGDVWWWAKSVTKPSVEVATNEYQILNQRLKYPGLATWNDVTIRIVDVGGKAKDLLKKFTDMGFKAPNASGGKDGITKTIDGKKSTYVIIEQYDGKNKAAIEKWGLANGFIKSINFGELEYSSDEFVEIEIIISYDWAELIT